MVDKLRVDPQPDENEEQNEKDEASDEPPNVLTATPFSNFDFQILNFQNFSYPINIYRGNSQPITK